MAKGGFCKPLLIVIIFFGRSGRPVAVVEFGQDYFSAIQQPENATSRHRGWVPSFASVRAHYLLLRAVNHREARPARSMTSTAPAVPLYSKHIRIGRFQKLRVNSISIGNQQEGRQLRIQRKPVAGRTTPWERIGNAPSRQEPSCIYYSSSGSNKPSISG